MLQSGRQKTISMGWGGVQIRPKHGAVKESRSSYSVSTASAAIRVYPITVSGARGTPKPAMKTGIQLHLTGLLLSDAVSILEQVGVNRHRTTAHR